MAKKKDKKSRRREYPAQFAKRNALISAGVSSRYGRQQYTPYHINLMNNREISRELSLARSILRKRYKRGVEAGVYTPEQEQRVRALLTPVREIPVSERPEILSLIARELSNEATTITGAREKRRSVIESFRAAGFDFINQGNVDEFLRFVNEFTAEEKASMYGSDVLYDYYKSQKERQQKSKWLKVSRQSFLRWLREQEG